uniref:Reverse transcriptase RNase H-like domain-containing protein n=1 Tax=Amphimedon queenslandica TaxID=400682 RepID=A0A1X7V2J4_AMPQE
MTTVGLELSKACPLPIMTIKEENELNRSNFSNSKKITIEEHLQNLEVVLSKLSQVGLKLKQQKCIFLASEVEYLGYTITKEGIKPSSSLVQAIQEAKTPTCLTELRAFLAQQNAFKQAKELLQQNSLLIHFHDSKPIILAFDASPYGIGAVLSHKMSDGSEHPISFASRSLTPAEKHYSQLDKEVLAIVFGVKKFHSYTYGHKFVICSDHKPLFNETKPVPFMASARLQRWALTLSTYQYSIKYKPGHEIANADALSIDCLDQSQHFQIISLENSHKSVILWQNLASLTFTIVIIECRKLESIH